MLIMPNSYSADFYRFLQFPWEIHSLNTKRGQMLGKNCPRQLLFRFVTIFRRKHIVKMNSVKTVLAMADGMVETVKLELSKMGSYRKYAWTS